MFIAGVDIGNSTTEVCISDSQPTGKLGFVSTAKTETTGLKGTVDNLKGVEIALQKALAKIDQPLSTVKLIRINEATPVIGDTAMETITETVISDSTMLGHNPSTPAGEGIATGITKHIKDIHRLDDEAVILIVPKEYGYEQVAVMLNTAGKNITGIILQNDEAVLVYNRLVNKVPILDEVMKINDIPLNMPAAIEVAGTGKSVTHLSNPYGIAKSFKLSPTETSQVIPIAKSLIGKKSAVVIKSIKGGVVEKTIEAGILEFIDEEGRSHSVRVDHGGKAIMTALQEIKELEDVKADDGSYVSFMFKRMKESLSSLSNQSFDDLHIKDLLAIDTFVPVKVSGALSSEVAMEKAVAIAAMVKTQELPMKKLAKYFEEQLHIPVEVAGVEAAMASVGALTTPGTTLPIAILDLGGGSTDAAILSENGTIKSIHLAGAGAFVTMMINEELALENLVIAEWIKRYPLAKVNSLYHITMENGEVIFFKEPLDSRLYARVILVKEDEYIPLMYDLPLEKILSIRKQVKEKVFVNNALRGLEKIAPQGNIRLIPNVVLVGGSALDFEIPELIQQALADYNIVAGRGDIQGSLGARNAVATGLCMTYDSKDKL